MSTKRETAAIVGVGAAACAACCAGPILGFLAAIGLGTALGVMAFGMVALVAGAILVAVVVRRRRRTPSCSATDAGVAVDMPTMQTRR